jgi:hypothetical protein
VEIITHLAWYWFTSGRNDALVWVPRALERLDEYDQADRARTLLAAGITYCDAIDDARPLAWLDEATYIFRGVGNERALGSALWWHGRCAAMRGDVATAEHAFNEAMPISERLGDLFGWGWSCLWIAGIAFRRGETEEADAMVRDVIARCESVPHVFAAAWQALSQHSYVRGDLATADEYACRAIDLFSDLGDRWQVGINSESRARINLETAPDTAAQCAITALVAFRELNDDPDLERVLRLASHLLMRAGHTSEAATLIGASERRIDHDMQDWNQSHRPLLQDLSAISRDPAWSVEVERGRRLGIRDAADAAVNWLQRTY